MTADTVGRTQRHAVAMAAMLAFVWSAPALAQTRLYLLTSGDIDDQCSASNCDPGRLIQIDVDRQQITASTPIRHARSRGIGPRVTYDGRFLLWSGSEQADYRPRTQPLLVSLFNIAGQQQATPFAASADADYAPLTVHPSEMRAYFQLSPGGPVTVAEPEQTRTLPLPPCAAPQFYSRSGDGSRLSYYCNDPVGMLVVDSADGRLLGRVPHWAWAQALDREGHTMFAVVTDFWGFDPTVFQRFDVATGALLAERVESTPEFDGSLWGYNPMTGHLYAGAQSGILVLDAITLTEVGRIGSPHPALHPTRAALDQDLPHAYVAWAGQIDGRPVTRLSLVHTGTLATLGSIEIPIDGALVGMTLGPRPPRLSDLNVRLEGSLATLTWTIAASRSIATEQVLEVGFAPGETALRLGVAAGATSLTVPGVPPGRYYVRIRSVNGTGLGVPSNEVLVDVP